MKVADLEQTVAIEGMLVKKQKFDKYRKARDVINTIADWDHNKLDKQPCPEFSSRVYEFYRSRLEKAKIDIGRYHTLKPCCISCLGVLCVMFPSAFEGKYTVKEILPKPLKHVYKVTEDAILTGNSHNVAPKTIDSTSTLDLDPKLIYALHTDTIVPSVTKVEPKSHFSIKNFEGQVSVDANLRGNQLTKSAVMLLNTYAIPYDHQKHKNPAMGGTAHPLARFV